MTGQNERPAETIQHSPLPRIELLLNRDLPALLNSVAAYERGKAVSTRIDGRIIGTGVEDFTKGNTIYTLNYKNETFQLIDVPGIEGDEAKYAAMVREAIAKAHLVFYVNGTNKKPEKATAEKIRSYLRRGTKVCPLVNVRGNADSYEFEEDRTALEQQGGAANALKQTVQVLESALGQDVLLKGQCVQGLIGFSALAYDPSGRNTSIHPTRDKNLVIQQRNFLKHFGSRNAMFEFSRVKSVAQVLHTKLKTFKEDIVESNKNKAKELLAENLDVLRQALSEHQAYIKDAEPEFHKCRAAIQEALKRFACLTEAGRKNILNDFFNDLGEKASSIVATHIGDSDHIEREISSAFKSGQGALSERLRAQVEERIAELQESVNQAMRRLIEDVGRVEFQQRGAFGDKEHTGHFDRADFGSTFSLGDLGSSVFKIGSYAAVGASIGAGIGGSLTLGALAIPAATIGAAIGVLVGSIMSGVDWLLKEGRRIRKAQAKVREKLEETRSKVSDGLKTDVENLAAAIDKELRAGVLSRVNSLHENLVSHPLSILNRQIAAMEGMKEQLEKMPHGTIHAIQR